jgi:hypothetical protein
MESTEQDMVKGYVRIGPPILRTIEAVGDWAEHNGGELAVRVALAEGQFSYYAAIVQKWLELEERKRLMAHDQATLIADQRAAQASERAARWAMWSALISAAAGVISAATYWLARVTG